MGLDPTEVTGLIRDIPDFPKPGITFKDITPLLGDGLAFHRALDAMSAPFAGQGVTKVVGMEARGFIFAAPVALELEAGFVPVRKAGKLPWAVRRQEYQLEYGVDLLEMHDDAVLASDRVLIVDDVLATGGTAAATIELVASTGATVVGCSFLIELAFLDGRGALGDLAVHSLVGYA